MLRECRCEAVLLSYLYLYMRKIIIMSDTHGCTDDKLMRRLSWADEIWHAGDIGTLDTYDRLCAVAPVRAVYGNADGGDLRSALGASLRFECDGVTVLMTHIGGYPGHYSPAARTLLAAGKPALFVCGHSHILRVMYDHRLGMMTMNPGAAGLYGWQKVRTLLRLTVDGGAMSALDVVEF